jgi:hypothetical protein
MPEGGFTFEVQQLLAEDLCRGSVVKAFSRRVIIAGDEGIEVLLTDCGEISFPRQEAAHTANCVLD